MASRLSLMIVYVLTLRFLDLFNHYRYGFEEVADYAVIGYVEDRGLGIFVDRNDGPGVLHSDDVLDRTGDT
jgi:hypothetical protein